MHPTKEKLAIHQGNKLIPHEIKKFNSIGEEEIKAASDVIKSGVLSQYLGAWHDDFYGGPKVKEFEEACKAYFNVEHAITVNSWTSGLIAAVGALDIEPGDEIIVSPWTMSASATAILHWNAIPVFADIDPDTFCIDPKSIEANITSKTKAIISIDIFGQSADVERINAIAKKHNLKVISDTAQAPGSTVNGKFTGTLTDIGGYSLNYHKHIHTGEGGVIVTNDSKLAERMRMIRNHAEAVIGSREWDDLPNMVGHNFRLGEIECAMGIEELKNLDQIVDSSQKAAESLTLGLKDIKGLKTPSVREGCTHVYYIYPMVLDLDLLNVKRELIVDALKAEGVPAIIAGYQNIHRLPMYQRKIAYGSKGFPWTSENARKDIDYSKGICPVAEKLHDETFIGLVLCLNEYSKSDTELVIEAFKKVWSQLELLNTDSVGEV